MGENKSIGKQIAMFNGEPYFLRKEGDVFLAMKRIFLKDYKLRLDDEGRPASLNKAAIEYYPDIELYPGKDIQKAPDTGLSLLVNLPNSQFQLIALIQKCRSFAHFGGKRYVTLKENPRGGYELRYMGHADDHMIVEIKPEIWELV